MNCYRIRYMWSDIKMYVRHIYRRVRYQWFCRNILVRVPNLKMYRYTDIDNIFNEVNFHLFCNFVERERDGRIGLQACIDDWAKEVAEGPSRGGETRTWYNGEKELYQRHLDKDVQILEIYTYLQERKLRDETYWDLSLDEQEKIDDKETEMLVKIVSMRRYLWT